MNDFLITKKLTKIYNEKNNFAFTALKQIDLKIDKNEFIAVMGPNGSGKTTFINIIGMLDIASQGYVKIENENTMIIALDHYSKNKKIKIGTVLQNDYLLNDLSVYENLEIPLFFQNMKNVRKKINEISSLLKIKDLLNKFPFQCSAGQRMKIAIARAIIHSPLLVIADEPTGNLDEESSMEIMDIFQMLHKKGLTVIMVTHQKNIASFSERTLLIFDGEIKKDLKRNHLDNDQFEYIIQKNYEYLSKEAEEKWKNSLK